MTHIIPAIDIIGGRCVRLTNGDYSMSTVYSGNPVDMAKAFVDAGCNRLHLVDLDGAKGGHIVNYKVLEAIASATSLVIDFGGGVKSDEDIYIAFDSGAAMVTGGSVAVKNHALFLDWLKRFGADRIILGADAKNGKIAVTGWTENSDCQITEFVQKYVSEGVAKIISTDVGVDGTLMGPSIEMYRQILNVVPSVYLIASGGVSAISDLDALTALEVPEVIVGKAIYEGRISMRDLEMYNLNAD